MWLGGHRALTHSVFFAVIVAGLLTVLWKGLASGVHAPRWRIFAFLASAMIAHGFLDMFTDDFPAVAIFAPFSWQRFEAPWEVFHPAWIEILVVWIPCWLFLRYRNRTRGGRRVGR
jgi:membrane-bound metal-dependent hydrolase YbcI (DUF457 family)